MKDTEKNIEEKRDFAVIIFARFIQALLSVITIRIATTYLDPENFGHLAILVTIQTCAVLIFINPFDQLLNRRAYNWFNSGRMNQILEQYRYYVVAIAVLAGIFVALWCAIAGKSIFYTTTNALAILFVVAAATINATNIWLLNMLLKRTRAAIWALVGQFFGILMAFTLVRLTNDSLGWFVGQAIGYCLSGVGAGLDLKKSIVSKSVLVEWSEVTAITKKDITQYVLPLAVTAIFMWICISGYRIIFEKYWGLHQLGTVVVAINLACAMWAITESIAMQYLYPLFFKWISHAGEKIRGEDGPSHVINSLGPAYLIIFALSIFCAPYFLNLLVAPIYASAKWAFILGSTFECCRALGNIFATSAQIDRKMRYLIYPYGLGAVLILIGISMIGYMKLEIVYGLLYLCVVGLIITSILYYSMNKLIPVILDVKRWSFSLIIVILAIVLSKFTPSISISKVNALYACLSASGIVVALLYLIARNNYALHQLLSIKNIK